MSTLHLTAPTVNPADLGKVAVLMGGWSAERDVSLMSGNGVADALERVGYKVSRVDMDRNVAQVLAALRPDWFHGIATAACWILPNCWASGQFVLPATLMENSGCWIPVPPRSPRAATPTSTISVATSGFAPSARNAPTNGLCNSLAEY